MGRLELIITLHQTKSCQHGQEIISPQWCKLKVPPHTRYIYIHVYNIYIYNTYSTSPSTIWENILRARKIFSRAKGE